MASELRKRIKAQVALESLQAYREGAREAKLEVSRDEIVDNILDAVIAALPEKTYSLPVNDRLMTMPSELFRNKTIDEVKSILEEAKKQ